MRDSFEPKLISFFDGVVAVAGGYFYKADSSLESNDYASVAGVKLPMSRLEDVAVIEQLDFEDNEGKISTIMNDIIGDDSALGESAVRDVRAEVELLEFLVLDVFKYFVATGVSSMFYKKPVAKAKPVHQEHEVMEVEEVEVPQKERKPVKSSASLMKLMGYKAVKAKAVERKVVKQRKKSIFESVIDNMIIIEGVVYGLGSCNDGEAEIRLGGRSYKPVAKCMVDSLFSDYRNAVMGKIRNDALDNHPKLMEYRKNRNNLSSEIEREIYRNAGIRVVAKGKKSCYVCLDFPDFVNIGEDGGLFHFPGNKVGVGVTHYGWNDDGNVQWEIGYPVVVSKNGKYGDGKEKYFKSPFLSGIKDYNKICLGNFSKSYSSYEEKVAGFLNVAKTTVMKGYIMEGGIGPHNRLNRSNFSDYEISKKELKELGKQVLNR
ncbi:MAG: hypothetical protein ABIB71_08905 [Candidatus Woesearchaeota archaeon]